MKSEIVESILRALELKEKDELKRLQKSQQKLKIDKLVDANSKDRKSCSIGIFEGDCLYENTLIKTITDDGIKDIKIKDSVIGDTVITHNNRFGTITAISKKIGKKVIIKNGIEDIICSNIHKWFVYDNTLNKFYFIETKDLDKNKHKLVKNYLAFMETLLQINNIEKIKDEKYDYCLDIEGLENSIYSTTTHKFACYNKDSEYFEMVETKNINKDIHLIVNLLK